VRAPWSSTTCFPPLLSPALHPPGNPSIFPLSRRHHSPLHLPRFRSSL
jgi:hypothetical protein